MTTTRISNVSNVSLFLRLHVCCIEMTSSRLVFTPCYCPCREPGCHKEECVCAEGGSGLQNKDHLQGKAGCWGSERCSLEERGSHVWCRPQVNKEIVSGLRYVQTSFRKGVKGESSTPSSHHFLSNLDLLHLCY